MQNLPFSRQTNLNLLKKPTFHPALPRPPHFSPWLPQAWDHQSNPWGRPLLFQSINIRKKLAIKNPKKATVQPNKIQNFGPRLFHRSWRESWGNKCFENTFILHQIAAVSWEICKILHKWGENKLQISHKKRKTGKIYSFSIQN